GSAGPVVAGPARLPVVRLPAAPGFGHSVAAVVPGFADPVVPAAVARLRTVPAVPVAVALRAGARRFPCCAARRRGRVPVPARARRQRGPLRTAATGRGRCRDYSATRP